MVPITLLTSASSIAERGPLRRVLPAGALITLLIGLLVSGAASGPPNVSRVARQLQHLGAVGAGVLVISVAASAVFIAPVFGYLSGVLQGTMMTGPVLYPVRAVLTRRHRSRRDRLTNRWHALVVLRDSGTQTEHDRVELLDIDIQLSRAPLGDPRPTTLGNVLAAAN